MSYIRSGAARWLRALGLNGRIGRNLSAQVYSQAVTLAIQFATIPLLVLAWGIEGYGAWLVLTALPAYLALSDFGFTFVAKNTMSMQVSAGNYPAAIGTFHSVLAVLAVICAICGVGLIALAWTVPLDTFLNPSSAGQLIVSVVLSAQIVSVLLTQFVLLFCAALRADGRPATETIFAASFRLFEATAVCTAALLGGDLALAALAGLAARAISLFFLVAYVRMSVPWLPLGVRAATVKTARSLLGPSLSYLLVPFAHALLIQGPVVILGVVASPATVALYSVTRTVSRVGVASANMLNFAFIPEYTYSFARRDHRTFNAHLRLHGMLMVAGVAVYALLMLGFTDVAVRLLSHDQIAPLQLLSLVMMTAVVLEMVWSFFFTPVAATNSHNLSAFALSAASVISIGLAATNPGVVTLAAALAGTHAVMLIVAVFSFTRVYGRISQ